MEDKTTEQQKLQLEVKGAKDLDFRKQDLEDFQSETDLTCQ